MPLEKLKAESIIGMMRSQDVQKRLDAINKAREMFRDAFRDCKCDADWAFSAYCVETMYNLVKDELRAGIQERIGKSQNGENGIPVPKKDKVIPKEKKAPKTMDMASMIASFTAFQALQKTGGEVKKDT